LLTVCVRNINEKRSERKSVTVQLCYYLSSRQNPICRFVYIHYALRLLPHPLDNICSYILTRVDTFHCLGNDTNKLHSGRKQEQIKFEECFVRFDFESCLISKVQTLKYKKLQFCLFFAGEGGTWTWRCSRAG
jgi:hypothetical protein